MIGLLFVGGGVLLGLAGIRLLAMGGPCTVHLALGGMALIAVGVVVAAVGLTGFASWWLKSRANKRGR